MPAAVNKFNGRATSADAHLPRMRGAALAVPAAGEERAESQPLVESGLLAAAVVDTAPEAGTAGARAEVALLSLDPRLLQSRGVLCCAGEGRAGPVEAAESHAAPRVRSDATDEVLVRSERSASASAARVLSSAAASPVAGGAGRMPLGTREGGGVAVGATRTVPAPVASSAGAAAAATHAGTAVGFCRARKAAASSLMAGSSKSCEAEGLPSGSLVKHLATRACTRPDREPSMGG
mmetsp:Transcript_25908/g.69995  ORF Transcript_25908/g.69995 Transcript_25908/m.69995 type:complete len:236 (-) Transcript_25908:1139-1846(-)